MAVLLLWSFFIYSLFPIYQRLKHDSEQLNIMKDISEMYFHMTQIHAIIYKKEVTAGNRIRINIQGVPFTMSDLGSLAACTRGSLRETSRTEDLKCIEVRPSTAHFILR